jgi:hypothetical protein
MPEENQLCKLNVHYESKDGKENALYFGIFKNGSWEVTRSILGPKFTYCKVTHWKPVEKDGEVNANRY